MKMNFNILLNVHNFIVYVHHFKVNVHNFEVNVHNFKVNIHYFELLTVIGILQKILCIHLKILFFYYCFDFKTTKIKTKICLGLGKRFSSS